MRTLCLLIIVAVCVQSVSIEPIRARFSRKLLAQEITSSYTNCNSNISFPCSGHGKCMPNGDCVCDDSYVTHNSTNPCNYKQTNALGPFLIEIFFGSLGVGWFVIGNIGMGVGQLLYFLPGICIITCIALALGFSPKELN